MKRYDSYKPSGIEWIGEIPSHWNVLRLKNLGTIYGGLTGKAGDDFKVDEYKDNFAYFIPFTNIFNNTYIKRDALSKVKVVHGEKQNIVKKGDVLFLMSSEDYEGIGKASLYDLDLPFDVLLNSFCKGFNTNQEKCCPSFLNYILNSDACTTFIRNRANGFIRINLRQDELIACPIILPPLSEQQAIADYLDKKCEEIDKSIAKQQRRIELLEELKHSVITQAVTRGLDPNVPLRDSDIEWIGEIPEHWTKIALRHLVSEYKAGPFGSSLITSQLLETGEILVYTPEHIAKHEVELQNNLYLPIDRKEEMCQFLVTTGDVLIPIVGTLGRAMIINNSMPSGIINQRLAKFKLRRNHVDDKFFLYYFVESQIGQIYNAQQSRGSIIVNLTKQIIYDMPFLLPPLPEQQAIADYLDKRCTEIDSMIEREKKKIELMQELKQSIITEVVTGKRKVV